MLPKKVIGFIVRFILIYGLLIAPWPDLNQTYGSYFRALGTAFFSSDSGPRVLRFAEQNSVPEAARKTPPLATRVTLANRNLADSQGNGPAQLIDLDTRSIGWVPTALTTALILASPVPWKRRLWALLAGWVLVQLFLLFSLQSWIWDASPAVSLETLSPFWQSRADDLEYVLITQLGASFSVPLVIWVVVTFRRRDLELLSDGFPKPRPDRISTRKQA